MSYRKHPEFQRMLRETASREALEPVKSKSAQQAPRDEGFARPPRLPLTQVPSSPAPRDDDRRYNHRRTEELYVKEERRGDFRNGQYRDGGQERGRAGGQYREVDNFLYRNGDKQRQKNAEGAKQREAAEERGSDAGRRAKETARTFHGHTPSELQRIKHTAHAKCMCQICTCNRPDHLCPINYMKEGRTGNTNYRADFQPVQADRPLVWRAEDNLRTLDGPTGSTVYKKDFNRKNAAGLPQNNDQLVETIVENNARGHIKHILGLPENFPRSKSSAPLESYTKPQSYIKPPYKPYANGKLEKNTVYKKDFLPFKGDYEGLQRVNYDNLQAYQPDVQFNGNTVYRLEHGSKAPTKPQNDAIGEMIRYQNKYTHPLNPELEVKKRSEYKEEFNKKQVDQHHCAIYDLPPPDMDVLREGKHVYYDETIEDWQK